MSRNKPIQPPGKTISIQSPGSGPGGGRPIQPPGAPPGGGFPLRPPGRGIPIASQPEAPPKPPSGFVPFALGFRPFFLLGPLWGVVSILVWLVILEGGFMPAWQLPPGWWHGHEMVFGFVGAMAAGFLLTAVPNWTGGDHLKGRLLAGLVGVWLAGRLVMGFSHLLPFWLSSGIDLLFLFLVMLATGLPVIQSKRWNQGAFPALLGLLWCADVLFHLEGLGVVEDGMRRGLWLGADVVAWIIVIFGGRMLPMFTRTTLLTRGIDPGVMMKPWVEWGSVISLVLIAVCDLFLAEVSWSGWIFLLAALIHGVRLAGWQPVKCRIEPLVWVLHLGYGWLIVGFFLRGLSLLWEVMPMNDALHAQTVGAIGMLAVGISSRVSLAHTGRPLMASRGVVGVYLALFVAALVRVLGGWIAPEWLVPLSGLIWIGAFGLFVSIFAPKLLRPRLDGRPG
ncbi:MAG: NnrS family protein [Magnetococcales bacterium]|nr:NnrS family protein [Magnetococcales bacterium]